jgi:hypothetical protein
VKQVKVVYKFILSTSHISSLPLPNYHILFTTSISKSTLGQKYPTPTPGFGDRVFYETLLKQRPDSIMAQEWCVAYGVLPWEQTSQLHAQILHRKRGGTGPVRTPPPTTSSSATKKSATKSNNNKRVKVVKSEHLDEDDPDMPLSSLAGEGMGRVVL